jgi:hypothetical protein
MPTQEQKDKIIDIIRKDNIIADCLVQYVLIDEESYCTPKVCENAGHCAIGALLFAAGYTNAQLIDLPNSPDDFPSDVVNTLATEYGLTQNQASIIVEANDEHISEPDNYKEMSDDEYKEYYLNARRQNVIAEVTAL